MSSISTFKNPINSINEQNNDAIFHLMLQDLQSVRFSFTMPEFFMILGIIAIISAVLAPCL